MSHQNMLGIVIGVICIILLWYRLHGAFVNWMLLAAGLLAAGLLKSLVAPYLGATAYGVGIAGVLTIILGVLFYAEVIKGSNKHPMAAPTVAFLTGLALVLTLGSATQMIAPSGHLPAVTSVVQQHG